MNIETLEIRKSTLRMSEQDVNFGWHFQGLRNLDNK